MSQIEKIRWLLGPLQMLATATSGGEQRQATHQGLKAVVFPVS